MLRNIKILLVFCEKHLLVLKIAAVGKLPEEVFNKEYQN